MDAQEFLKESYQMLQFTKFLSYFEILSMIIAIGLAILTLYFIFKLKRNSDYILKMQIYEFEKNNPEKPFTEIINETRAYVRVKF